jgi:hypothetical protein
MLQLHMADNCLSIVYTFSLVVKLSETLRDIIARMEKSDQRIQELIKDHISDSRKFLTETEQILRDN